MDKPTLLQITQNVLNDISGDEVTSINDTVESIQVATIIQSIWFNMMTNRNWPHTKQLIQPLADGTLTLPTHFLLSPSLKELVFVNYDKSKTLGKMEYNEVKYLHPDNFLRFTNQRNTQDANTQVVTDPSGITINLTTNCAPTYYTSFNDLQIIFDSYDKSVETFLQKSKFQMYAYIIPDWTQSDTFIPPLPIEAFPSLIEEAKSTAAVKLRQQPDQKSEQEAQKQRRFMARKDWSVAGGIRFPNYGRSSRYIQTNKLSDPTFRRDN